MTPENRRNVSNGQTHETTVEAPTNDYLALLTNISDTVLITNEHGNFTFICPNIDIIFGFTDKEIAQFGNIGRLWGIDLIRQYPPGSYQEIRNIEIPIIDKYENIHILLVNMKAVSIFGGTILFTCRDITERKQAEVEKLRIGQALAENEAALATLINSVDDSIFSIDRDKRLLIFNTSFERRAATRLGISLHKGMALADYFPGAYLDVFFPLFDRALAGESSLVERRIYFPERNIDVYSEISCNPMYATSGEITGAAVFSRDVTESKKADLALRISEERFRIVIENVPLAFHIYDSRQGTTIYSNPLYEWMFDYVEGKENADIRIRNEHINTEEHPLLISAPDNQEPSVLEEHEFRLVFPSGVVRHMRQLDFPIVKADNTVVQMASFIEDITERKQIEDALRQNERLLDKVINHAFYGIAALVALRNDTGQIVDFEYRVVNAGMARQFQRSPAQMIKNRLSDENPDAMSNGLFERFVDVVETGEILDVEHSHHHAGLGRHYRISGVKLDDGLVVTYADITEQKTNQIALMRNRALLENILRNLPIEVAVISVEDNRMLSLNDRYAIRLKRWSDELVDQDIAQLLTEEDLAIWNRNRAHVLQTGQPIQSEVQQVVDGSRLTLLVDHFPLRDNRGNIFGVGRIAVDITEQKRVQDQLRELSRQIVEIQENERRHIARELHDEVGQTLTGVLLLLNQVRQRAGTANLPAIDEIQALIRALMSQIRELSQSLHPPILDNHGLLAALRWYCDHYSVQTQIGVTFKNTGSPKRLPPGIELTCYRIVQESLTNIARYAHVQTAAVHVSLTKSKIKLVIEDHGVGFNVEAARARSDSFGLLGMSERVALLKGKIDIVSSPGQGTRVSVEIPLETI